MNRERVCNGVCNTGKCVVTQEEGRKLGLNMRAKRIICVNMCNEYGECDMDLVADRIIAEEGKDTGNGLPVVEGAVGASDKTYPQQPEEWNGGGGTKTQQPKLPEQLPIPDHKKDSEADVITILYCKVMEVLDYLKARE